MHFPSLLLLLVAGERRDRLLAELEAQVGDVGTHSVLESTLSFFAQLSEARKRGATTKQDSVYTYLIKQCCPLLAQDLAESLRMLGADAVQEQLAQFMKSLRSITTASSRSRSNSTSFTSSENANANANRLEEDNEEEESQRRSGSGRLETVFRCCLASELVTLGAADVSDHFDAHVLPEWMRVSIHYLCDLGPRAGHTGMGGGDAGARIGLHKQ